MRKLDSQSIIWPAYFDIGKTRKEGRRLPKNQAVQSPRLAELQEAVIMLGLESEVNIEAHFPKTPWAKTGMLIVEKDEPKEAIIKKIAKQLSKIKSQQTQQLTRR